MRHLFIIFISATVISFIRTPIAKRLGIRLGVLDIPGELSIHSKPTSRSGGFAMIFAFSGGILLYSLLNTSLLGKEATNAFMWKQLMNIHDYIDILFLD